MNSDYGLGVNSWAAFGCFMGFLGWMVIDISVLLRQQLAKWIVG